MIYHVTLTRQAQVDLREIPKYIAVDLQSVENASGQLDRLEKAIAQTDSRYPISF